MRSDVENRQQPLAIELVKSLLMRWGFLSPRRALLREVHAPQGARTVSSVLPSRIAQRAGEKLTLRNLPKLTKHGKSSNEPHLYAELFPFGFYQLEPGRAVRMN